MNTYERGLELARTDIIRHGLLHAIDKAEVLDGPIGDGYNEVVSTQMLQSRI